MADDSDSEQDAKVVENRPYDESFDVEADEVASVYTPSPNTHRESHDQRHSRGDTPPKPAEMSDNSDDDFDSGQPDKNPHIMSAYNNQGAPPNSGKMYEDDDDDDDDEDDDDEDDEDEAPQERTSQGPLGSVAGASRLPSGAAPSSGGGQMYQDDDDDDDDDDSGSTDDEGSGGAVEGAYDPADYEHLPVTPEIKELFGYITRYTTQTIELEHKLKPFIPDFIPSVGDIDAFIKIPRPDGKPDTLGLSVLDEPCAKQSDPTVLDLQLRAVSKQTNLKAVVVKSIEDAENNHKAIDNWISSISDIHRSRPPPNVHYTKNMPDIDTLMQEWPADFEELLKEVSLPGADIDCDLATYVELIMSILDIPIYKSKVQSLHVLFTLYSEFKNSQHFKSLAAENKIDNSLKTGITGADTLVI